MNFAFRLPMTTMTPVETGEKNHKHITKIEISCTNRHYGYFLCVVLSDD